MKFAFSILFLFYINLPSMAASAGTPFEYLEFYRAIRGDQTVYIHGTVHIANPEENPLILTEAIHAATVLYTENFSKAEEYPAEITAKAQEKLREKTAKRVNEPDWLTLFKAQPFTGQDGVATNLYDYLQARISTNLGKLSTIPLTVENVLQNCSAFGILIIFSSALNEQTSDPTTCYDARLLDSFKRAGKPFEMMESITESGNNLDNSHLSKEMREIIDKSCEDTEAYLDTICIMLGMHNQLHDLIQFACRKGWGIMAREFMPNSKFIDGRTSLWFTKYFSTTTEVSIPNYSLFCMGVSHLHSQTNDEYVPTKPGFLGMLEETGWALENLRLDGSWVRWTTVSHLKWIQEKESEIKRTLHERFPTLTEE